VGFFRVATLQDSARLLQRTGKFMRYVKLRPETPTNAAELGEPLALRAMMNIILNPCLAVIGRIAGKLSLPADEPCDDMACTGETKTLFHLLRTGATRDAVAIRRNDSYKTFGPKVVAWTELSDDPALNNRCIMIPVHEIHRTDLTRTANPEILDAADDLQRQFLQFRFEKLKTLKLANIHGAEKLYSRSRDLYEALALPVCEDSPACEDLARQLKRQQKANREPLPTCQAAVLETLFLAIHMLPENKGKVTVGMLTSLVNGKLEIAGEGLGSTPAESVLP
jgi:hypothetical protein